VPSARLQAPRFKAFISYNHAADDRLAPALQTGLQRFAKPWHRLRALRVFRDKTGMAVTPALWGSVQQALQSSEYFVLLASPQAAASKWVEREVEFWLTHRSADTLLIVLTDGVIVWDKQANDFDWTQTSALPRILSGRFAEEPKHLDLGWASDDSDLSLRRPRFMDAVASLSATLRGVPLDDLIGRDLAQHRTSKRLLQAGVALVAVLVAFASYSAFVANRADRTAAGVEADRQRELDAEKRAADERTKQADAERVAGEERERAAAESRALAATAQEVLPRDRELATLLAIEAVEISATPEAESVLREALVRPVPPVALRGPERVIERIAFSRSGGRLLAVFEDGSIRIWTMASGTSGAPIDINGDAVVFPDADGATASFSADEALVLTAPYRSMRTFLEPEGDAAAARLWDAATGRLVREFKHPYVQHAAISPDGRRVVTGGDDRRVVIWDAATGVQIAELEDHERGIEHVEFSADGRWFLTAAKDDLVHVRTGSDGKPVATLQVPGKTLLRGAMFSPDARWILSVNTEDPPRLWDWQRAPGASAFELSGHTGSIVAASFSPDSTRLVTADDGNTARVWDVAAGRNIYTLEHDEFLTDAAFSTDGRWIATTSIDRTAALWDAANGKRILEFGSADNARTSVAFSQDGARVATGTTGGQVLVYPCEVCGSAADLVALARSRVTRALTPDERKRYIRAPGQ